jgi:hypothetical protein
VTYRQRGGWCAALLIAALAACGGGTDRHFYRLTWPGGTSTYDPDHVSTALARCLTQPGSHNDGSQFSLPPITLVSIEARSDEVDSFARCLAGVPGARVRETDAPE